MGQCFVSDSIQYLVKLVQYVGVLLVTVDHYLVRLVQYVGVLLVTVYHHLVKLV